MGHSGVSRSERLSLFLHNICAECDTIPKRSIYQTDLNDSRSEGDAEGKGWNLMHALGKHIIQARPSILSWLAYKMKM